MPRVHAELKADGVHVGRKRVARLMRQAGLVGASRRKGCWTTRGENEARPAPDLVQREFAAAGPDRHWIADIERHEALSNRAVMNGHRRRLVAASRPKLGAA